MSPPLLRARPRELRPSPATQQHRTGCLFRNALEASRMSPIGSSQSGARQLPQHEARERAVNFRPGSCGKPRQRRRIGGEPGLSRRDVQQSARSRGG